MNIADSVQETTSGTSTATVTLVGATVGNRSIAAAIAAGHLTVGQSTPCRVQDDIGNWLTGLFTITSSTVLTRTAIGASSAGGADVTLAGTVRTVSLVPTALWADSLKLPAQPAFSSVIPLDAPGLSIPAAKTLTGALTLTMPTTPAPGAQVYQRIIGDGTSTVTVVGAQKLNISADFDSRAGIENQFQFFNDASGNPKYCISQVEGAIAVDNVAPVLSSPTATQTGPNTATGTVSTNEANGTLYCMASANATETTATIRASGTAQTITATGTKTFSITGLTASTLYYLHFAHRDLSNNDSNVANSTSITTAAAATVPSTMSSPVITAGDGSISIAWTAPAANGSAIIDATFTASTGQTATGTTSPTTMTVPNGTAVTVTGKARNGMGTATSASPASNSVTPAAAAAPVARFAQLSNVTESGTTPNFAYVGGAGAGGASYDGKGVLNLSLASGADGEIVLRVSAKNNEVIWGLSTSTTPVAFSGVAYGIYVSGTGAGTGTYRQITSGSPANGTVTTATFATNDYQRIKRIGTTITASKSSDGGATWTVYQTWTGASTAALYVNLNLNTAVAIDTITTVGLA
ncbi:hypothetical protein [Massilia sp. DWR3-1-1]|uniref:hypothetical protein n=1 Tax=Massilia sp. DWR3-1-1 TaxID=2804559 RepID=UPI003CFAC0D7